MKSPTSAPLFGALLIGALFYSSTTMACEAPEEPNIPDASSAVTAQMVKAQNDMEDYMAQAQTYLACVSNMNQHNRMVSKMEKLADRFNAVVRAYRERMAKV